MKLLVIEFPESTDLTMAVRPKGVTVTIAGESQALEGKIWGKAEEDATGRRVEVPPKT